MKVRILGGSEVGASSADITVIDDTGRVRHILIDSGKKMGPDQPIDAGHIMPESVDMIILTHGHLDHIGYMPMVMNRFPEAVVMMSRPTVFISALNWYDSCKIMEMEGYRNHDLERILWEYSHGLENANKNLRIIDEPGRQELFPGIFGTFFSVGHLSGAMGILIEANGKRVFFTGDISFQDTPTIVGADLNELPGNLNGMFVDSTHGVSEIPLRQDQEEKLIADVKMAVAENRPTLLIGFSIGRAPDIGIRLAECGVDCYIDSGTLTASALDEKLGDDGYWCNHDIRIPYEFEDETNSFKIGQGRIKLITSKKQREALLASQEAKVIIASSGMLSGGWSVRYAGEFLQNQQALVALTGYQGEGTPGRDLFNMITGQAERGPLTLYSWEDGEKKPYQIDVNSDVKSYSLSGHANPGETIEMINHLRPVKTVLVHGETKGREALRSRLGDTGYDNSLVPQDGDTIEF